jgi:hypothetical protein
MKKLSKKGVVREPEPEKELHKASGTLKSLFK